MPKDSEERANARKEEIINACAALYETVGYKDITIRDIGKKTSFTRTAIYHYFQTKEEIFLALLQREHEAWAADLEALAAQGGDLTPEAFAGAFAATLGRRGCMLKLMSMNLYDMEGNSRMENLVAFKRAYAAALRAAGDSASPLYFLVLSSVINILLDLLFVPVLGWGAVGAAVATVLAQAISALLCYLYTAKQFPQLHLRRRDLVLDSRLLRTTVGYSQSAALQQTCFFIGKFLLQGAVNPLGTDTIAAFNAVSRIEGFVLAPGNSIATAVTTFIAQNKGARKPDRIFDGFRQGCRMAWGYDILMVIFMYLLARPMTSLFVDAGETAVVAEGVRYLHAICPFYLLPAMGDVMQGFFRGIGKLNVSLFGTIFQISIRVALTYLLAGSLGLVSVSIATGTGWCLFLIILAVLYRREKPRVRRALSVAPADS